MLESYILETQAGVSYGSGAIKALQNNNMPEIDLLVREAIQNSSDASLKKTDDSFCVDFNIGNFCSTELNNQLEFVSQYLNKRYSGQEAKYLEIRDSKTEGLTGPVKASELNPEDHGNYWKLVYDTGKEQLNSDSGNAGGSWGYGKSVYYRTGIGLVIYYSRIKQEASYEQRLIVALVENETDDDSLLTKIMIKNAGHAWWGKKDPDEARYVLPVTNEKEIQDFLNIFGLKEFQDDETGTSIIIPYIDINELLMGIYPESCGISSDEIAVCNFKDDIREYIKIAVQKWYAPKIFNKRIGDFNSTQKWLACRIDGAPMLNKDMRPIFRLIQELYLTALSENKYKSQEFPFIQSVAIPSKNLIGQMAGYAAFISISKDELGSSAISPYTYLRLFGKGSLNDPIVMFARSPGMIIDYKIDGKWAKHLEPPENQDDYLFVFFVPNGSAVIKNVKGIPNEFTGMKLGEYLRKTEKSDHTDWIDESHMTIISNIQDQIYQKVNEKIKGNSAEEYEGTTSKLSGKLGKKLLPTLGYGKPLGGGGGGNGGESSSFSNDFIFQIESNNIFIYGIELNFKAIFKKNRKTVYIGLFVESEIGNFDANSWIRDIGTPFPITILSIKNCVVHSENTDKDEKFETECTVNNPVINNDYSQLRLCFFNTSTVSGFEFDNSIEKATVYGTLVLKSSDRKYCCSVKETKQDTTNIEEKIGDDE